MTDRQWVWIMCAAIAAGGLAGCFSSRSAADPSAADSEATDPKATPTDSVPNKGGHADAASMQDDEAPSPAGGDNASGDGNAANTNDDNPANIDPGVPTPPMRCSSETATATTIDKVDLLFVVDNSGSMREEQAALRAQFPSMIAMLTGGTGKGTVKDLHLGVVSSDMGLVGISDIQGCANLGDDGIMQHEPRLQSCKAAYPPFLTFNAGLNSSMEVANDFACVAALGTEGCGFEQQLESGLKALWPGIDDRLLFLGDVNGFGTMGHGDNENQGFLRNDPATGLSLIAIVVVTDEEDCSSKDTRHFTPATYLDPQDPSDAQLLMQGLNVRCNGNPDDLYAIERYINGFKALRPGNEDLVVFAAIVGVPPETVSADVLEKTDFSDAASRHDFYAGILQHELMQNVVDLQGTPDPADDTMRASCNTVSGLAYPPRRIVEAARGFGANGIVQSICQDDFGPALDVIAARIGERLAAPVCPPL